MAITSIIFALEMSEDRAFWTFSHILALPLVWFFLQGASWVEFDSLVRALYTFSRKREVTWQKWQRTGVADS